MKKLFTRYFLVHSFLVLITALLFFAAQFIFLENYFTASVKRNFRAVADAVAAAPPEMESLTLLLRELGNEYGCKVMIVDARGDLLASSAPEFRSGNRLALGGAELSAFRQNRAGLESGESVWQILERKEEGIRFLYYFAGLSRNRYLVIQQTLNPLRRYVNAAAGFFAATIPGVLLIALLLAGAGARRMTKPVLRLTQQAQAIARQEFEADFPETRQDEIGDLGRSMNSIARDLSAALRELRGQMESQKRFLASVAHEIRTPVGLLKGYAELFDDERFLDGSRETVREAAHVITDEADHLNTLLEDLLLLFRVEQTTLSLNCERIDAASFLEKAVIRYQPLFKKKGITLSREIQGNLFFFADYHRMVQIVDNLMTNALRHTPEGGNIRIGILRESHTIVLSLWNSGSSIPEADLAKIFDPLYRLDSGRIRSLGGVGLGLSVVKALCEAQQGSCRCENRGKGILFTVELPAAEPDLSPGPPF